MNNIIDTVIDTNVLVSALWSKVGNPSKIAHLIPDGKIVPHFCDEILNEYKSVLSRPSFDFSYAEIEELLRQLVKYGKNVVVYKSNIPLPDESDRIFYDTAKTSEAILITGNTKHFPPEEFIMTPSEFLRLIENKN